MKPDFSRYHYPETASAWLDRMQQNNHAKVGSSELTIQQAHDLFHALANLTDMGWGFVLTTCYPKAYLMCEMALAEGIRPFKMWAFKDEDGTMLAGVHPSAGSYEWDDHVALALPVKMEDGVVKNLVFDPSMFDSPVSQREWGATIGANPERMQIVPYDETPSLMQSNWKVQHTPDNMARALQRIANLAYLRDDAARTVFQGQTLPNSTQRKRIGWNIADETPSAALIVAAQTAPQTAHL